MFTNFPAKKNLKYSDSSLLDEVKVLANYISQQPFWNAQVAQLDITQDKNFEMIPVVGNHLVRLGDISDIDKKFRRLLVFYREVLSKTSFDRYKIIDVQYKGQVVASRSEGNHKTDSIQLKRNVEKLLKQSIEAEADTVVKQLPPDLVNEMRTELITDEETEPVVTNDPVVNKKEPVKPVSKAKTEKKTASKVTDVKKPVKKQATAETEKKPKAVMPKKIVEEPNGGYN